MKEMVILSGKGGTGKTSIICSFAALSQKAVFADCDVDAADMHLLFNRTYLRQEKFFSGTVPIIDPTLCTQCGRCEELCKFHAIQKNISPDGTLLFETNHLSCEGCGVCIDHCLSKAIREQERLCGHLFLSQTEYGVLSHAKLLPGGENSGKLVSAVRKQAQQYAQENQADWILIDGSPGIGCPVIASITGADRAILVAEPTLSGIHDLERIFSLCQHFGVPISVCVNKADINKKNTLQLEHFTKEKNETWLGTIPYDNLVTKAQNQGVPVVTLPESIAGKKIREIWKQIINKSGEQL